MLTVFRITGTILSGSRALAYFLPSHRKFTKSSDWDIFVPFPHQQIVHDQLVSQGFLNVERIKPQPKPDRFLVYDYFNAANAKIQLVALKVHWSMYDNIMNFHKSTVQNIISGWGVYSIHWQETFNKSGWLAERLAKYPDYEKQQIKEAKDIGGFTLKEWANTDARKLVENVFVAYYGRRADNEGDAVGYLSFEKLKGELLAQVGQLN